MPAGTVLSMARTDHVNADFLVSLGKRLGKNPDILNDIAEVLGSDEYSELEDAEQFPVAGFFVNASSELLQVFAVTPGRFCLYERNAEGDMLGVTVPLERVRRVVSRRIGSVLMVTIELEADRAQLALEANFTTEPRVQDGRVLPDNSFGRLVAAGSMNAATYVLRSDVNANEDTEEDLRAFTRALRNSVGY